MKIAKNKIDSAKIRPRISFGYIKLYRNVLFACHLPGRLEKVQEAHKYKRFLFAGYLPEPHIEIFTEDSKTDNRLDAFQ